MRVTVKFFASIRELLGTGSEMVELPAGVDTVGALRAHLAARGGVWTEALDGQRALRMACNQVMCDAATPLKDNSEVAYFPPVTGG